MFSWIDRPSLHGRVDSKTENTDGHERYPARTSIARKCGRIGPDGDEHLDGRRLRSEFVHTMQLDGSWRCADTRWTLSWKNLEARRVQVLDSDWFKTDHKAVLAVLSLKPGVNLRGWKPEDSWQKAAAETLTDWKIGS